MTARNSYGYEVASYDSESLLQELLVKHIVLLLGEQINSGEPRRSLLITSGLSVLDRQDGFARWPLDQLLLDQDTVPTTTQRALGAQSIRIRCKICKQWINRWSRSRRCKEDDYPYDLSI